MAFEHDRGAFDRVTFVRCAKGFVLYCDGEPGQMKPMYAFDKIEGVSRWFTEQYGTPTESRPRQKRNGGRLSMIDMAIAVLGKHPDGLTSRDLIREIDRDFERLIDRTSLSPQLTRAKERGLLKNTGDGRWAVSQWSAPIDLDADAADYAAQGIETRQGEDPQGLRAKHESPVAEGHAPKGHRHD